jgi:uncharacterized coiled-coil protein SlyX
MNALERVIAEQQSELDGMKIVLASQSESINTVFTQNAELFEKFSEFLDAKIPDKTDEAIWKRYMSLRRDCRLLMTEAGFCCQCRNFSCECENE